VTALLLASEVRTCLGNGADTFAALLAGRSGVRPVAPAAAERLGVRWAYPIGDGPLPDGGAGAGRWLTECVAAALARAGVDPGRDRVLALVGTGLRELRTVERAAERAAARAPGPDSPAAAPVDPLEVPAERLHFAGAVADAVPGGLGTVTLSNACSAGGHALALAQDLVELGDADAVVVAAADTMTASMLAMIGRVGERPTEQVRPFDAGRTGVLLGDGAAALVVAGQRWEPARRDGAGRPAPLARLLSTGLSCDAHHETAPDVPGIRRAMRDALDRAGRAAAEVDLVVAHGTGTALNDPAEARALREELHDHGGRPLVTATKGAVGHTSGVAALLNVDVAVRSLATGQVPPVVGLRTPDPEVADLRLVTAPVWAAPRLAVCDAFGFGGVNAVTLLEPAA
jgi:3-oxoacyl-[acyl-carrier-protein] synthase II